MKELIGRTNISRTLLASFI